MNSVEARPASIAWGCDFQESSSCEGHKEAIAAALCVKYIITQHIPFAVETEMECFEGSREPIRGWVGLHGNDAIPAPLVEFRYPTGVRGGSLSAVLLAPFSGATPPAYRAKRTSQRSWGRLRHIEMILPVSPVGSKPATCGRFKTSQSVILLRLGVFLLG
jgi:hypothetical protein